MVPSHMLTGSMVTCISAQKSTLVSAHCLLCQKIFLLVLITNLDTVEALQTYLINWFVLITI